MKFTYEENRIVYYSEAGDILAEVTFPYLDKNTVDISHTFVDSSLRGQGVAGKLMSALAGELKERNLSAIATCSYAQGWFQKHVEYNQILK